MDFVPLTEENIARAAAVHAASWQKSHEAFCSEAFVAEHTPKRQESYLRREMAAGKRIWLLEDEEDVIGLVSVHGSLIENLYVAPEKQNRGYGTMLLHFAIDQCEEMPTLWILDNNHGARRLYERNGFAATGRSKRLTDTLCELELKMTQMDRCHEVMQNALFESGSLEALAFLINAGRELEFTYRGVGGFISCDGSKKGVSVWTEGAEQSFAGVAEMIDKAVIAGKTFRSVWNEIEIKTLF